MTYFQIVCYLTLQYKKQPLPLYCFQVFLIHRVSIHTTSLVQPVKNLLATVTAIFPRTSIMYLLQLLPLASLALALPQTSINLKRSATCGAQEWAIQGFESFQMPANFTPAAGTPAPYNYTHLTFTWVDPNLDVSGLCEWSNLGDTGEVADGLSYPCGVSGVEMSYQYFGAGTLSLQETPVACDK